MVNVPEANKIQEAIPEARLELFDECGHWLKHKRPELNNLLTIAFFKENSGKYSAFRTFKLITFSDYRSQFSKVETNSDNQLLV